jgi:hypothetical protein
MSGARLLALALLGAAGLAGCGGCNQDKPAQPVAATSSATPTSAGASAAPPAAPAAGAAATTPQGNEADCFVIVDAEPDFGAPPLTVHFTTETDCTGAPVTFTWDFGDGTKGGNDAKPSHTYQKAGDYVATVSTTAPDGGTGSDEIDITVDADLVE